MVSRDEALRALTTDSLDPGKRSFDRSLFYVHCRQQGQWLREVTGHEFPKDAAWFEPYCPTKNISATYPPTILVHGTEDVDVPHEESERLAQRFVEFGVTHRFVSMPGVGHGFSGAEVQAAESAEGTVADFLAEELRPLAGED